MYCSGCGQAIPPGQNFCGQCGRPAGAEAPAAYAPPAAGRVERHLRTVGVLWIVYAVLGVAGWLFALPFITGGFGAWTQHWGAYSGMQRWHPGLGMFLPLITVYVILRAIFYVVTAIGLLRHERWGRVLAIIAAILALLHPVLGTALGIFTLWVLAPRLSGAEYDRLPPA